ncbi:MAG: hypothetical protein K0S68_918 [Candidatus Saccharibacteria bacterium]|jgi:uncharacterized membrane protein YgcG|nr:hypothetical protein [Candidatus Saccharibacteria bacterium]
MKRAIAVTTLAALFLATPAYAGVDDFTFTSFTADYKLTRDKDKVGHLRTVERLDAVFPDFDQNHGIIRAIPQTYEGHRTHLKNISVTDNLGNPLNYTTSSANNNLELKIGDADRYVHGPQTYVITYDSDHVTAKPAGYDAIFWDVNGDGWRQPFGQVTARIQLAEDLRAARDPSRDRCFTGPRGSTGKDCTITDGMIVTIATTRALSANETLTYELGFKPGTFAAYTIPKEDLIQYAVNALMVLVPILIALWLTLRRWLKFGRDPSGRGIIAPEYQRPKDLTVLQSSALIHETFKPSAITATVLDLAVRGYVKLYEVKKEIKLFPDQVTYDIELVKSPADLKPDEQQALTVLGLTEGSRVSVSSLSKTLYKQAEALGKTVNQSVADAGYFRTNPEQAKTPFLVAGFVVLFLGFFLFFLPFLAAGVIGAGLVLLAFSFIMPARTAKGVEARDHLLGLKMYMTVAEEDRIKAMQSPTGKLTEKIDVADKGQLVKVFERLLPFAMLFGIEKQWIKEFADLYSQPPDWYSGSGSFNAAYFAGSMSSFNTATTAGFSPPSSSGSGGSSGGGGGGGGGGGW